MQTKPVLKKGLIVGIVVLFIITNISLGINSSKAKGNLNLNMKNISSSLNDPSWEWAVRGGGTCREDGNSICVDSSNSNIYLTGHFNGTASFSSTTLTSRGGGDVFVAKLDADGNWQWAVQGGGILHDWGYDICVDSYGNTYLTGYFQGNALFGPTTLTSSGYYDVFVAKLDADGNWQWAVQGVQGGETCRNIGLDICVDSSNSNIYLTGYFNGTVSFGSTILTDSGCYDVFVAKLDADGNWQWAVQGGGTSYDIGNGICVDSSDNTYLTGHFVGNALFGSTILTGGENCDVFVAKLDVDGNWEWAVGGGVNNSDDGYGICVDSSGSNIYLTGFFVGTASFGSIILHGIGNYDVFVAKIDTSGNWLWAIQGGGMSYDWSYDICVDSYSNTYITGFFKECVSFGSTELYSHGAEDVFVAKLDADGNWQWAGQGGGTDVDTGYGACVDSSNNTYLTGYFIGTAVFGSWTLTSNGDEDVFVVKLSNAGNQPPVADFFWIPQNPVSNQQITFDASTSHDPDGTITTYEWDWDHDGTYDETHSTPTATHSWANPGNFLVTVRVTDDKDATSTSTKPVNVSGAVNFTIDITGGFGIKATITNTGTLDATNIQWKFTLTGGLILLGKNKNGTIVSLAAGASRTVKDSPILGFGKTTIKLDVTCAQGVSATQTRTGIVVLFFVIGVK